MTSRTDFQVIVDAGAAVQIRRRAEFRASPWRNGGGVTHEAMRRPSTGDAYDWRVSVAEIASSGPFSAFDGYRRHMLLLSGAGLELEFPDGRLARLLRPGDLTSFAGSPPPECRLIAGPCVDLNLICAHGLPVETWLLRGDAQHDVGVAAGDVVLAFCIEGTATLVDHGAETGTVGSTDLAVIDLASPGTVRVCPSARRADSSALFLAKLAPSEGG